jgi:hypothetical protein
VLRYRIVSIPEAAVCAAAAYTGSPAYLVGGAGSYQQVSAALAPTTPLAIAAGAASPVHLCIELSVADSAAQAAYAGTQATASLSVTGTSS